MELRQFYYDLPRQLSPIYYMLLSIIAARGWTDIQYDLQLKKIKKYLQLQIT